MKRGCSNHKACIYCLPSKHIFFAKTNILGKLTLTTHKSKTTNFASMVVIQRILYTLWKCLFLAAFCSILLLLYPFLVYFLAKRSRYKYAFYCQKIMATWICFFSGIFIKKIYEIDPKEIPSPCVIV